jgi:hypothetical protein
LRIPEVTERIGSGRTKIYDLIATGELPTIRIVEPYAFPSAPCRNDSRSVNSKEDYPPEKRRQETTANAKNVATHVATSAIFGGKWR